MLQKLLILYVLITSANASNQLINIDNAVNSLTAANSKTARTIIDENRHLPEYMNPQQWIETTYPDFHEDAYKNHPFYYLYEEARELADFELDTLENFIELFMHSDMPEKNASIIMTLRHNAYAIKTLTGDLIELMQAKSTIPDLTTHYFRSRFVNLVNYQNDLKIGATYKGNEDPHTNQVFAGFLRSYNTKNKIYRDLLYYYRAQENLPLIKCLPPELINYLRFSITLHPFFNRKNEEWADYDTALKMGEARIFLGNAAAAGLNLRNILGETLFKTSRISKRSFKKTEELPVPDFLTEIPETGSGKISLSKDTTLQLKKKRNRKKKGSFQTVSPISSDQAYKPDAVSKDDTQEITSHAPESLANSILQEAPPANKEVFPAGQEEILTQTSAALSSSAGRTKFIPSAVQPRDFKEITPLKISNTHVNTIYDIFSPKGYAKLNSDRIISAWNHVMGTKGYHKENTGGSHQPLYARLEDSSSVVLGLFASSGYGPRYIKYVRNAFDKIGFGRLWLLEQGYILN